MSGIGALMSALGGGQQPILRGGSFADVTPNFQAAGMIRLHADGTMEVQVGDTAVDSEDLSNPAEWGGPQKFTGQGNDYDARLTVLSGTFGDSEFSPVSTWLAIDTDLSWRSLSPGTSGGATVKLEIRRHNTQTVVASGTYVLSWRGP